MGSIQKYTVYDQMRENDIQLRARKYPNLPGQYGTY